MITVVKPDGSQNGITVGLRKDGSRAVLWDDNTVQWFNAAEFSSVEKANV